MSNKAEVEIIVTRKTTNLINDKMLNDQFKAMKESVNRASTKGVTVDIVNKVGPEPLPDGERGYNYAATLKIESVNGRTIDSNLNRITIARKYIEKVCRDKHWEVKGEAVDYAENGASLVERVPLHVPDVLDLKRFEEAGLYERDAHIRIVHDGVKSYQLSKRKQRSHTLLFGQPASAKTELFLELKKLYEQDDEHLERIAVFNSTTLSKAGLEDWIMERAKNNSLPDIILLDEIEKIQPEKLSCLLTMMDKQGQIIKLTATKGRDVGDTKILVWATCNDIKLFKSYFSGALYSRFQKKLPCVRPSKDLMKQILLKKIRQMREEEDGNEAIRDDWVDSIMNYAEEQGIDDPREILDCLTGRERLTDGTYFDDLRIIKKAQRENKALAELM